MNRIILLLTLLLSFSAIAAPASPEQRSLIAHMTRECRAAMRGACKVETDSKKAPDFAAFKAHYPSGRIFIGAHIFTPEEYWVFVGAGKRMCLIVAEECAKDYDSRSCQLARELWRQR